jgi:hypothetical protein
MPHHDAPANQRTRLSDNVRQVECWFSHFIAVSFLESRRETEIPEEKRKESNMLFEIGSGRTPPPLHHREIRNAPYLPDDQSAKPIQLRKTSRWC